MLVADEPLTMNTPALMYFGDVVFAMGRAGASACTIEGQGHEWPGARRTLPRIISGPQTDKLDATRVVWDFFAAVV